MTKAEKIKEKYTPKYLDLWTYPDSYAGATWYDYYVFLGQHRDSDSLTRSNFICGLEALEKILSIDFDSEGVISENHWAVGWVEWIAIHKDNFEALEIADEIAKSLEDYPVVNEDHWSNLETDEMLEMLGYEFSDDQEKIEKYFEQSGYNEGRIGSSVDEIDYETIEKINNEE